jgi:hypothetical protein
LEYKRHHLFPRLSATLTKPASKQQDQQSKTTQDIQSPSSKMRSIVAITLLGALHGASSQMTGLLGDAMAITNNPRGATYAAMIDTSSVTGKVVAMSGLNGKGVMFNVSLMNLPMSGGPYSMGLGANR